MPPMLKSSLLRLADLLAWIWQWLPAKLREGLVTGLYVLESRGGDSARGLRRLAVLQDRLEWVFNERAMAYGGGYIPSTG